MPDDDHALARDLAEQAGQRLVKLRARGGDPDLLRKAGDRLSHEFLSAELADRRPGDVVLSEEGADHPVRLGARRVWIVDPLDGPVGSKRGRRRPHRRRGRPPRPGPRPVHAPPPGSPGGGAGRDVRPDPHRGEPESCRPARSEYFRSY